MRTNNVFVKSRLAAAIGVSFLFSGSLYAEEAAGEQGLAHVEKRHQRVQDRARAARRGDGGGHRSRGPLAEEIVDHGGQELGSPGNRRVAR